MFTFVSLELQMVEVTQWNSGLKSTAIANLLQVMQGFEGHATRITRLKVLEAKSGL